MARSVAMAASLAVNSNLESQPPPDLACRPALYQFQHLVMRLGNQALKL